MNVLIIPEDFRQDQFILKPIIKAMLSALGKRRATVKVCREPIDWKGYGSHEMGAYR